MRIITNGWYRTRGGHKVGPMRSINQGPWKWTDGVTRWTKLGEWSTVMDRHQLDIVAPWLIDTPPGPIRTETVTTRRIEPGVYGRLYVRGEGDFPFGAEKQVDVGFVARGAVNEGLCYSGYVLTASELRDLARVATELAEFLDAQ